MTNPWNSHMKETIQQLKNYNKDQDFQVQVIGNKPPPKKDKDSFSIFFDRLRTRKQTTNTINLEQTPNIINLDQTSNTINLQQAPKHQSGQSKDNNKWSAKKAEVIDVEEAASKRNVQKYKQSLFQSRQAKPIKASPALPLRNPQVEMKKQIKIIEDLNKPNWVIQREQRRAINREKYPLSYTHSYNHNLGGTREFTGLGNGNQQVYQEYLKKRQEKQQQNKEKKLQEQEKQKKRKAEEDKKKKQQERYEQINYISDMFGAHPQKKIKQNTEFTEETQSLKKTDIIEQIAEENGQNNLSGTDSYYPFRRQLRCGLKDHIQNTQQSNDRFFNAILKYDYSNRQQELEQKRIPDSFEDSSVYRNIFHYLITTQCIADIKQRLKKISSNPEVSPIKVTIENHRPTNSGRVEISLKQVQKQEEDQLKNYSLSRNRLALISSSRDYSRQFYGVKSGCRDDYAFVGLLVTPQTKEDLSSEVKLLANLSEYELQDFFLRRKSKEVYYFDLEKVTTSIREYLAVSSISQSEIAPIILDPSLLQRQQTVYVSNRDILSNILQYLRQIFNQTQWLSIREMVLREWGFVLLQGPPGTGKTSTLMGLLSAQYEYLKKMKDNRKIMICAPSNAAVDHIVKRIIRQGFFNGEGEIIHPSILRVGIVETDDKDVRSVSLDDLCEIQINQGVQACKKIHQMTMAQIKQRIIEVHKEARRHGLSELQKATKSAQLRQLQNQLYKFRSDKLVINRKKYSDIQQRLLANAQIILTTLTSSGADKLDGLRGQIACLIVDEAAQATEPNLLIALQTGVEKVILIGDPYQLPATCISQDSNVTLFNRSLFQRLLDAGIKPYFLNMQYRMAPKIRSFPSARFYHDRLVDADSILKRQTPSFLNNFSERCVLFIDVSFGKESKRGDSYCNEQQAKVASLLIRCLIDQSVSLGLITPYQAQRKAIIRDCYKYLDDNPTDREIFEREVMINTVDSFQGQERDIIIVSTVRANSKAQVGFLTDERRINVTLTRAKHLLVVIGHGNTLGSNEVWNDFLDWIQKEKCYYVVRKESESEEILAEAFTDYSRDIKIHRKKYQHLSTDIRKVRRKEIVSQDFKSKLQKDRAKIPSLINRQKVVQEKYPLSGELQHFQQDAKHALGPKQCQQILEQKRQKQAESLQFEEMCRRMQEFERQNYQKLKGDACYRHLLQ